MVNTAEVISYLDCLASLEDAIVKNAKAGDLRMALKCLGELACGRDASFVAATGVSVWGHYGPRGGEKRVSGPWADVVWGDEFGSWDFFYMQTRITKIRHLSRSGNTNILFVRTGDNEWEMRVRRISPFSSLFLPDRIVVELPKPEYPYPLSGCAVLNDPAAVEPAEQPECKCPTCQLYPALKNGQWDKAMEMVLAIYNK